MGGVRGIGKREYDAPYRIIRYWAIMAKFSSNANAKPTSLRD